MIRLSRLIAPVALIWLLAVTAAVARPKTDVVTLNNGDRLTGEIKKLDRGILEFKTESLDTVHVEWPDVVGLRTEFIFEFRSLDGRFYFGSLVQPEEPDQLAIATEQGLVELPFEEITLMQSIEAGFWSRLDGSLSFGLNAASGSNVTQIYSGLDALYRTRKWESSLDMSVHVNKQDPEDTSRETVTYQSMRLWKKRRFGGSLVALEANEEQGLDFRLLLGGAFGRDMIESPRSRLRLAAGLALNREDREDGTTDESVEGVALLIYDLYSFRKPKIDLSFQSAFYPNLSESERLRADLNLSLDFEIIKDLDWGLSAYESFNSDPATEENEKHDWGVTTTISWDF